MMGRFGDTYFVDMGYTGGFNDFQGEYMDMGMEYMGGEGPGPMGSGMDYGMDMGFDSGRERKR